VFEPFNRWNPIELAVSKIISTVWNWTLFDSVERGYFLVNVRALNKFLNIFRLKAPKFLSDLSLPMNTIKGTQDFIGLNYYTRDFIKVNLAAHNWPDKLGITVNPQAIATQNVNDMGWEIYPQGISQLIRQVYTRAIDISGRRLNVFISENGIADRNDSKRKQFIEDHLIEIKKTIDEGIPVKGYCHWTLMDNFEWNSGYYPRFGLYSVDVKTLERTIRPSAQWFSETVRNNAILRK
jgi:beta-glucosidase